jgi:tRNA(Ile2) C34 agmatinyltransferase TiaS
MYGIIVKKVRCNNSSSYCNNNNNEPVIIGATGTISVPLRRYMRNIQGYHEIREIQTATIFGTAHVLWKVLIQKYKIYSICEITLRVTKIVNTEQLQHYIP